MGLALGGIVALAAVLRVVAIGEQSFWFDEYFTVAVVKHGFPDLFRAIEGFEATPPLYYLLAYVWEALFGDGEAALRSLSAILGIATVPLVFAAGRQLADERTGLIAAAFTAVSPLLVWYSQEARAYALLVLLSALGFLCFARTVGPEGDRRWLWGWAVASALALTSHYYAILAIAPQAIWLLAGSRRRGEPAAAIGVVVLAGAALAPLASAQSGRTRFIDALDLGERIAQAPQQFAAGLQVPWDAIGPVALVAMVALIATGVARADDAQRRGLMLAGSVALGGAALAVLLAIAGEDFLITRNLLALWAPAAVAVAVAISALRPAWVAPAAATALCAAGAGLAVWVAATPATHKPDWSELAAELGAPEAPRAVAGPSSENLPLLLYLPGSDTAGPDPAPAAGELVVPAYRDVPDHAIGPCWWGTVCGGDPLFPPAEPFEPPAAFGPADHGTTERMSFESYAAAGHVTLSPDLGYPYVVQP